MTDKTKKRIYLADLAYFNKYSASSLTIPLNIGYIASYTQKLFSSEIEVVLFKDPRKLLHVSKVKPPDVLGLSCYYWNWHLDVLLASLVRKINPACVTVIGGPQIDTDLDEQLDLYRSFKGNLDFMVLNEGELGFSKLIERILSNGRDSLFTDAVDGCTFFVDEDMPVVGKNIGLSIDLETLPSPFTSGLLDDFLTSEYMPILQSSRMCPYSCSYCCSGKLKGKIRNFPDAVVEADIEYIADKYRDNPHRTLYICDENFGINKRDSSIAGFLVQTREKFGYPRQTFCYFDKRLTETVKKSALLFADMNSGGLQLAFQTFNSDALKAVKRRNMSDEELKEAIIWAHSNGLKTSSDLIFGLPNETKKTFIDSLEFIMQSKIDRTLTYNLLMLKGMELNRKEQRDKFQLTTKFRPSFGSGYDFIEKEFVCESEEIVASSSHFSSDDFMDIRKIMLIYYAVNQVEYFRKAFTFLVDQKKKIIPIFDAMCNPSDRNKMINGYSRFIDEFVEDAKSELYDSHEEVCTYLREEFIKNGNKIASPIRLNFHYAARLIYQESWFKEVLTQHLEDLALSDEAFRIMQDIIEISNIEWIDFEHPESSVSTIVSVDTLNYLQIPTTEPKASKYIYKMSLSEQQRKMVESFNKQFKASDDLYYYNVLDYIHPRIYLRYECIDVEPLPE